MDRNSQQDEKLLTNVLDHCQNINRLWCSLVIEELSRHSIKYFYYAPGMRNAPFISALSRRTDLCIEHGIDERGLAYRALGASKTSGTASVLICTSGTALANFFPAVMEASKSNTPLIVISCDRPPELLYNDTNQTIEQDKIYQSFCCLHMNLGTPNLDVSLKELTSNIHILATTAINKQLPVHLNFPMREPLDQTQGEISQSLLIEAQNYFIKHINYHKNKYQYFCPEISFENKNVLIALGSDLENFENHHIELLNSLSFPIIADISNNKRSLLDNLIIPTKENMQLLASKNLNFDFIIHVGSRLTSKYFYQFCESMNTSHFLNFSSCDKLTDCSFNSPTYFQISSFYQILEKYSFNNALKWNFDDRREHIAAQDIDLFSQEFSSYVSEEDVLFIGNSSIIRSMDNYFLPKTPTYKILTNRGVSGIEGNIAMGIGIKDALPTKNVTVILGDLSFIHDLNSLVMLQRKSINIIILNNFRGDIFHQLNIARDQDVIQKISTPHSFEFQYISKQFNIDYFRSESISELLVNYNELKGQLGPKIYELIVKPYH
ncbi:MAG: 2-succinyl-5-enolpyruvyl-6-hydroxy-3-cyclohexene-1-carboxylic-acid synthase [Halobacteriovoraceae bacterium]|nr:2-succinyl-5-enolpyruvyl-6-hydroxy-3-cyclohexene-1-carboxylic-acid synthase [Halobacteriovoraceae bacterium]